MSKPIIFAISVGSMVTVVLLSLWLVSLLDTMSTPVDTTNLLSNIPIKQTTTEPTVNNNTTTEKTEKEKPKKEYDLNRVVSNGETMENPEDVPEFNLSESEKQLIRNTTNDSGGTTPGWTEITIWPKEIPVFNAGEVNSIMKSTEGEAWMILIDNTTETSVDNYKKIITSGGWETQDNNSEEDYYGFAAKKGELEAVVLYNPEVRQTIISAGKGINE